MTRTGERVAVVLLGTLVGLAFHRTLGWAAIAGWAVGTALAAGVLVAAAERVRSVLLAVVAPVAVPVGVIGALVAREVRGLPRAEALERATAVVTDGWAALLRDQPPVALTATTLVPVLVLTWVSTFLGSLALTARAAAAPLVPVLAGLAVAVLSAPGGLGPALLIPAVAVGPVVWLLATRAPVPAPPSRRAALAAGVALLAAAVGPLLPLVTRQPPFDLRTLLEQTTTVAPTTVPPPPPTVPPSTVTTAVPATTPTAADGGSSGGGGDTPPEPGPGGLPWWWLLVGVPLVVPGAKALRRYRRAHAPTVAARTIGAWREAADRLTEHGVRPNARATAPTLLAPWGASVIGEAAEAAAFGAVADGDDTCAWDALRRLERRAGWRGRWLRWLDPRPLWRRW